jgi:hypothetical protein
MKGHDYRTTGQEYRTNRRTLLASAGIITVSGLAGCLGVVGLDEHEASPAGVESDVREETGYEQTNIEERVIEETVEVAGMSEDIVVRNYLTEHEKSIDLGPLGSFRAASFVVLTSPQISVFGQELNPISEMSSEELIGLLESNFDGIGNAEKIGDGSVSILDQETAEAVYEAEVEVEGTTVDANIHVTESVRTENDHLVAVGAYPKQVRETEEPNIAALMGGIVETVE